MRLIEKLKTIRALIDTPDKWTKGHAARDKDGVATSAYRAEAVCFSLMGAGVHIWPDGDAFHPLLGALPDSFLCLTEFNDHYNTNHADVLALIDRAIEVEESA